MAEAETPSPLLRCVHKCLNPSSSPLELGGSVSSVGPKLRRSSKEHAGRNRAEKTLGYKYLLVSEYVARRKRFPGAAPYCAEWAAHNLAIFLEHQSYIEDPATVRPRLDRCLAERFA